MIHSSLAADELPARELKVSATYEQGLVFYDGEYVPGPYQIRYSESKVFINNTEIASSIDIPSQEDEGRYRERERPMGARKRQRPRENEDENHRNSPKIVAALYRSLRDDETVVMFDGGTYHSIAAPSAKYELYQAILESDSTNIDFAFLPEIVGDEQTRELWREWITSYTPPPALAAELASFNQFIDDLEAETVQTMQASARLENLAYPLTLAGMILSVIAFGQLLQWIGKGFAENDEPKPESERYLKTSLLLMLGMSLIDLFWTMLAGQAGVMREVNPVAELYLNSPLQLASFKVAATLLGLSILYVWRRKPIMQQATWWMCLVCVLVTFRWVVFNSMMS